LPPRSLSPSSPITKIKKLAEMSAIDFSKYCEEIKDAENKNIITPTLDELKKVLERYFIVDR
jgi:hypothetical protein